MKRDHQGVSTLLMLATLFGIVSCIINGNMTVTPSTIKANGAYSFTIDTSTIIPSGGYLTLTFPSDVVLPSSPSCSYQFGFTGLPSCTASNNVLKISGGFPSLNGIRFRVNPVQNPGSALNLQGFVFKFYSSAAATNPVDQSSATAFFFQYTTDTLSGADVSPGSWVVGEVVDWTLQITPKNQIPAGGLVKFFMPKWIIQSLHSISAQSMLQSGQNSCSAVSGLTSQSISCQFVIDPIATNLDVLIISNAFAGAQTAGSPFKIKVANVRNMPTTRPYSGFEIWTYDANSFGIDNEKNIEIAMSIPATLPSSQVKVYIDAPTTVDAITTYLFTLFINNPLPMGGSLRIRIPQTVKATYLTQVIPEQRMNSAVTVAAISSSDPNYVELKGGYPSVYDSVPIAGLIGFRLKYLKNPSTSQQSASFEITTYDSIYPIEQITTGLIVAGATGSIKMNAWSYSETRVLEYNSFSFDMTLQNALQTGCTIEVLFPPEFIISDVSVSSCKLIGMYGLSSGATCSITNNKLVIQNPFDSSGSKGGDKIKFTVANNYIQNPTAARTTTGLITIRTVTPDGNPIDNWTASSRFVATESSLSSVALTSSSNVAGDYPVVFTFTLRTPHQVEQNAFIYVKLPTGDVYVYDTSEANTKCTAIQILSQSTIKCNAKTSEVTITKGFPGGVCACQSDIQFSVGGMINPRSFEPTSSFTVQIHASDNYMIYQKSEGIILTMSQPNTLTKVTVSPQSGVNGVKDNYIFVVKNHNQKIDGDYMTIYAPSEITFTNETGCQPRNGIRGFYKCLYQYPSTMIVAFSFLGRRLGGIQMNVGFEFILTNIQNPPSMAPSGSFIIYTNTMDGYNISSLLNGPTVSNRKASNMTQVLIRPSVYSDGKWTNLTFSVTPGNYMQFMTMTIQVPPDVLIVQAAPNLWQPISSYNMAKEMVIDYFPGTRTIRILNAFTVLTKAQFDASSIMLRQLQFMIGQFINPIGQYYSGDFAFTTYDKKGYIIDQQVTKISYVCSSQCGSCSATDYTQCTSCKNTTVYRFLYLGQCVQSCPTGTTQTINKCLICPTGCLECSSESDTCATCKTGLLSFEGECIAQCPQNYVLDPPNSCAKIVAPVFSFTSYFQKTDTYQCFMFPFSAGSVAISLIMWLAVCCSKCLVNNQRQKLLDQDGEEEIRFNPLRLVELCIALISLIEVGGWGFFLYCMLTVQEKLPFYVIAGALGLNLFLNFVMTCGIMRSKENQDRYVQRYQQQHSCAYILIKFFTLFISHKGFYFSFARYQHRSRRNDPSHFDFSYFDSGDEQGMSGLCFKFFFLTSILLLHGAVIAACVLNYLSNDLSKKLFCLDLDILGMTVFQALLVLLTLLQCGGPNDQNAVHPEEGEEMVKGEDEGEGDDEVVEMKKVKKKVVKKKKVKGKNGKVEYVDEVVEVEVEVPVVVKKKKKGFGDEDDYSRNADKTIDPLEYEGPGRKRQKMRGGPSGNFDEDDIEDAFETIDKNRKNRGGIKNAKGQIEESDEAEEIVVTIGGSRMRRPKKKQNNKKGASRQDYGYNDEEEEDVEETVEEVVEDSEGNQIVRKRKIKKKNPVKKGKKGGKAVKDNNYVDDEEEEEEIEETIEEVVEDSEGNQVVRKRKIKKKKPVKKGKKGGKNGQAQDDEDEDEEEEETVEEVVEDSDGNKVVKKVKKKKVKKPKKTIGKKNNQQEEDEEEEEDVTVEEEVEEVVQDSEGNEVIRKKKIKKKAKKKKLPKKGTKGKPGQSPEDEEEDEEPSYDEEEVDEIIYDKSGKPSVVKKKTNKKKKPSRKRPSVLEEEEEEKEIIVTVESFEEYIDPQGQPQKRSKGKKKAKKIVKTKKRKANQTNYERVSHNASYGVEDDGQEEGIAEEKVPLFQKIQVDKAMKQFDQQIADMEEPSYRELVDQINNEDGVDRSRSPVKQGNFIQLNQDSKEELARVSAKYGVIYNSIPTQHDEQVLDQDQYYPGSHPQFGNSPSQGQMQNNDFGFSKVQFRDSQTHLLLQQEQEQFSSNRNLLPGQDNGSIHQLSGQGLSQHNLLGNDADGQFSNAQLSGRVVDKNSNHVLSQNQLSPGRQSLIRGGISGQLSPGKSNLPSEAQYEIMKTKEGFKTPTMSLENHVPDNEQRSMSHYTGGQGLTSDIARRNYGRTNQIGRQETADGVNDEEELKDRVNKDDIKPKTKILFSDKSESSVEDLMEDTPSNYNVLNGRLDEDSRGLRSMLYKAISKKILYQSQQEKPITPGHEDTEARHIVSSKSNNRQPSTSSSTKLKRREQAKLFIQKAESAGMQMNTGNTLLLEQQQIMSRHQRNASIGEIPSSKLLEEEENGEETSAMNKYNSQIINK